MKKYVSVLLAAILLLSCAATAALAASAVFRLTGSCHVYAGAGTGYADLGIATKGSQLAFLNHTQNTGKTVWYNVSFKGKSGWVPGSYGYLTTGTPTTVYGSGGDGGSSAGGSSGSFAYGTQVKVTGSSVNIRSGPSLSDRSLGTAHKGDLLTGTGSIRRDSRGVNWYSVLFRGGNGWISSSYAQLTGKSSGSSSSGSSSSGGSYSGGSSSGSHVSGSVVQAVSGNTYIRTGPGRSYKLLGTLHKGNSLPYLGQTASDERGVTWYKVSYNGSAGWVSSKYTKVR